MAVMVDSGTPSFRAPPAWAPQTYMASSSRATVMAASTRTRMSSEPSKRTYAPRCARRPASSGLCRNIVNGPCSAPRLATMPSTIAWSFAGTWFLLVMRVSLAMDRSSSFPQAPRGEIGALAQDTQLGPHDALLDELRAGEGAEAAVHAGEHARAIADRLGGGHDAVGHDLRMLDDVGRGVDDARHEQHAVGQGMAAEGSQLVLVPRARQRQRERADLRAVDDRQQRLQRHIVGVRPVVVAPAEVQADAIGGEPPRRPRECGRREGG